MSTWIQPSEHILKATEYITKADETATKAGINVESIPRLTVLAALAQVHIGLAHAKRSG